MEGDREVDCQASGRGDGVSPGTPPSVAEKIAAAGGDTDQFLWSDDRLTGRRARQTSRDTGLALSVRRLQWIGKAYERLSMPFAVFFAFSDRQFDPHYGMTWGKRTRLALRFYRNWRRIRTGVSYKVHLALAAKILEIPRSVEGVVVECGCWLGGTTANLSIICDIVGRDLIVYDSFAGLPEPVEGDNMGPSARGAFRADLESVRDNVRRHGIIDRCTFRKGWFEDSLKDHSERIVACFIDVDLPSSIHTCLVHLWPHLTERGYVFFDDYVRLNQCAVFFSEHFWRTYLDTDPPGLLGSGTGIGLGQYFFGPWPSHLATTPAQRPTSVAYTRKDFDGRWRYTPQESPTDEPRP